MRTLTFALPTLALLGAACSGMLVVSNDPHHPVVAEDDHPGRGAVAHLGIPPGHLPPPGKCRIWIPGRPPGHQPPAGNCSRLERELPAGAWLLYRPARDREHVIVRVCDQRRPAVIVAVRTYEVATGRFIREERR